MRERECEIVCVCVCVTSILPMCVCVCDMDTDRQGVGGVCVFVCLCAHVWSEKRVYSNRPLRHLEGMEGRVVVLGADKVMKKNFPDE